ncbi:MAG: non-heme iron oxygenase ferredoxin subunit [Kiloniellales bacterium]|nr:non-heme iron oxygenase ferredoxin subunit [Kiloniellales bacterium]
MSKSWVFVSSADEIDEEDVIRFDHGSKTFAVYNTPKGYFATDGICTHEEAHLADGLVIGSVIECPLHQGRFDIPSGKAKSAPVCVDLKTYPVKIEGGELFIELPA